MSVSQEQSTSVVMPKPTVGSAVGLVLPGGGARAAYQVGVLKAIAEWMPGMPNPFPVIVGTSAGAVAATVIGTEAFRWQYAVQALENVWANFHVEQVFRSDSLQMMRAGLHWATSLLSGGMLMAPPRALFDNTPLRQLLKERIQFRHLQRSLATGALRSLAICASSYTSASSVAFFQSAETVADWERHQRIGRRCHLHLDHVMASLGVPLLFPPVKLGHEFYGDGAQRQLWPLSPAIRLGADRLLIVGVRSQLGAGVPTRPRVTRPPSAGQLFGYMLDTLFMDQIFANIEHVEWLNQVASVAPDAVPGIRKVATLMIAPSRDLREIASRHMRELPRPVRALLNVMGAGGRGGAQLSSYMMFEKAFTSELIDLGYRDACAKREQLLDFLSGKPISDSSTMPLPPDQASGTHRSKQK